MATELTKKQWKLMIAEIILEYQEVNEESWIQLDDYEEFIRWRWYNSDEEEIIPGLFMIDSNDEIDVDNINRHYHWIIFKWKDVFYKFTWEYFSHRGVDFDCAKMYIVEPVQEDKISFN